MLDIWSHFPDTGGISVGSLSLQVNFSVEKPIFLHFVALDKANYCDVKNILASINGKEMKELQSNTNWVFVWASKDKHNLVSSHTGPKFGGQNRG